MGKTNPSYVARKRRHARVRRRLSGTSDQPRLNVFRSLNHIYAQVIDDTNGLTVASASSLDANVRGGSTGKTKAEQATMALDAGVSTVVFDRGGYKYHGRVKALAEAAREAGLKF